MKKIRRTTVTIQTDRLLVMSGSRSRYSFCAVCGDEVRMVTIAEAAALTGVNSSAIFHEIEAGRLHFIEETVVGLLVCCNSLNESNPTRKGQ